MCASFVDILWESVSQSSGSQTCSSGYSNQGGDCALITPNISQ